MKGHFVNEPLLGVAVYNPGILSKDELVRLFVARRGLLQQITDDLRREKVKSIPQHRLLVGARGMGKSTLLRRISYAVDDDPALSAVWIPLTFPEEQYNVARISDLWLNCLDALSDALERLGKHDEAVALDEIIDALPGKNEEERSRKALNALLEHAQRMGKRLLLLIDNIDLVLDRLAKEHWTIREMLAKEGAPLLIGATSRPLKPTYVYEGAFYDFFKIDNLNKLQLEEMHGVLRTLATELKAPQVAELLKSDPARIRVLYDLTGGNPRTTVLLFGVLAQGVDGDVRTDLERLLDQCTPLYKARFEELSNQAQQVVDALALHWDPATAAAVAEKARLDVNSVSSHLNRLSEQGIVEKVRLYPKKKTGFQLSERFFNIWYLMRASRRMRRKLIWLSKFLKSFYRQEDLHRLAHRYLLKGAGLDGNALVKHAEYGFALAEALEDHGWRRALEHTASRITLEIQREFKYLLGDSAIGLDEIDHHTLTMSQMKDKILHSGVDYPGIDNAQLCELLCGCPILDLSLKSQFVEIFGKGSERSHTDFLALLTLAKILVQNEIKDETLSEALFKAIGDGLMDGWSDVEGAKSAVHVLNEPRLLNLALRPKDTVSMKDIRNYMDAVAYQSSGLWLSLGKLQRNKALIEDAEQSFRKAVELDTKDAIAWNALGDLMSEIDNYEEAEKAYRIATSIDQHGTSLTNFAVALYMLGRVDEAEESVRKALDRNPNSGIALSLLGVIRIEAYGDVDTADDSFQKTIDLSPEDPEALAKLAAVLESVSRYPKAEAAYRKALHLKPDDRSLKVRLAAVLVRNGKWAEAGDTMTSAVEGSSDEEIAENLDLLVSFVKAAVTTDHAKGALKVLAQAELVESCRPLIEALKAVVAGTSEYLLNVAPEIRNAAEKIYRDLVQTDEKL